MAKVFLPPACDAALLSAYRDRALDDARQHMVEGHVQVCPACRQELARFEELASGLEALHVHLPYRPAVGDIIRRRVPERGGHAVRPAPAVAIALTAVLLLAFVVERAPTKPAFVRAYPSVGATNISTDTAITLTFAHPVNQMQIEATLRLEPAAPFDLSWESAERATIIPLAPLTPATTYTLEATVPAMVTPSPTAISAQAPPIVFRLTTFETAARSVAQGGPTPVVPRADLLYGDLPGSASQAVLSVPATPSPVALVPPGSAAAHPASVRNAGPACGPSGVFASLYHNRPDVRTVLGCAEGAVETATIERQPFQRGELLAVFPDGLLYQLTMDGLWRVEPLPVSASNRQPAVDVQQIGVTFRPYWRSHPSLAAIFGPPIGAEVAARAHLQRFAGGFMLAEPNGVYVADNAGQWQRLAGFSVDSAGAITGGVPSFPPLRPLPLDGAPLIASPYIAALHTAPAFSERTHAGAR